jgi:prepilin-type N-terminal cleavage/methylation domain-containing protein/prepilin-type processing-associated H-X9-DG protein
MTSTSPPVPRDRRAFTLIELSVAMAIIGVLVALLLPAVQAAREAARRTHCVNNLKQIGIALHNYHAGRSVFPPGYVSGFLGVGSIEIDAVIRPRKIGDDTGPGWGWGAMLMPHLENGQLFDALNFDMRIEEAENVTARLVTVSTFLCPSDPGGSVWWAFLRDPYTAAPVEPICQIAPANYVAMYGVTEPGPDGDGMFFRNSAVRMHDVLDGSSQTIAAGERSHKLGNATWVGSVTGAILAPPTLTLGRPHPEHAAGMVLGHAGEGNGPGDPRSDTNQFHSRHGRGGHFLFADGHVAFLKQAMDYRVYRALATRAGKEVVSGDSY